MAEEFSAEDGKEKMNKIKALSIINKILPLIICLVLTLSITIGVSAEETEGEAVIDTQNDLTTESANADDGAKKEDDLIENSNLFDEIYSVLEANADKIFSILAFLGTLVVGIAYKSSLIPLLRNALSRLKASIDKVQEDNDKNNLANSDKFTEISGSISKINEALAENSSQLGRIKWEFETYEQLLREREAMKTLLGGQIDLLYAIFMSSALPQYQKDEIGDKIQKMREELSEYENE